jgi:hypothetical protein
MEQHSGRLPIQPFFLLSITEMALISAPVTSSS